MHNTSMSVICKFISTQSRIVVSSSIHWTIQFQMVKMSEKEIIERMNKEFYIFISLFKYYSKQLGNIQYLFEVRGGFGLCI